MTTVHPPTKHERLAACILGGAIGDAWGSSFENEVAPVAATFYLGGRPTVSRRWAISDDTQLTLATCEVLATGSFNPELLAEQFRVYYQQGKLVGLGASTLKAFHDLKAGIHWTQAGRQGQYAAGNGAAMRVAPFAFYPATTRQHIHDACRITHHNEEAYVGALAVYLAIKAATNGTWNGRNNLISLLLPELPDTNLKDRLLAINAYPATTTIADVARLGNNGYVVNSVPLAIFCAAKIFDLGLTSMLQQLIATGGDTDTNASIAGQLAGALVGLAGIPAELLSKLEQLPEYPWLISIIDRTVLSLQ